MAATILTNKGSAIRLSASIEGVNLTGYTLDAVDLNQIPAPQITVTDAPAGTFTLYWSDEAAVAIPAGRRGSFRLRLTEPGGDAFTTTPIFVQVS